MIRSCLTRLTPRIASRLVLALIAGLMLTSTALLQPRSAAAGGYWCFDDPVLLINGEQVTIQTGVYGDPAFVAAHVTAANVVVTVPAGVTTQIVSRTNTYFAERVTFVTQGTWTAGETVKVKVSVTFTASADLPTQVVTSYPGGTTTRSGNTTRGMINQVFHLA